jgi:hypothetical protein
MDAELIRLIRERYPFPIAHAYKRTLAFGSWDTLLGRRHILCHTRRSFVRARLNQQSQSWPCLQGCYGTFHLVEYSQRLGGRVQEKPPTHSCAKARTPP